MVCTRASTRIYISLPTVWYAEDTFCIIKIGFIIEQDYLLQYNSVGFISDPLKTHSVCSSYRYRANTRRSSLNGFIQICMRYTFTRIWFGQ